MNRTSDNLSAANPESNIKSILEWLALAHGRTGAEDADQLYRQLLLLRDTPVPCPQRLKLLDLLYGQAQRITKAELPRLNEVSLPISRKLRQRVRTLLDILETLTQDYFNTLAELFDPRGESSPRLPHTSLRRAMHAISWQVRIAHMIASPTPVGLWQQLHAAFRTARRLGLDEFPGPNCGPSIRRIYTSILLAAIAQPVSFSAEELEFISDYIDKCTPDVELLGSPPLDARGIFWIDPDKDFPAHALIRRIPSPEAAVLYFSCDDLAEQALKHRMELLKGVPAEFIGLPKFAETHAGPGVLLRLNQLWGNPAKRRFPRRRQSYRANLSSGLGNLWRLMKTPDAKLELSEWMVTNESPEGYALMHMSGHTDDIRVGDIVALQATDEHADTSQAWHICIIRWAISENPEHIELGLQLLAPKATSVELANPFELNASKVHALILPATPPLRPTQSLIVPPGLIRENMKRIVVLQEDENLSVRELQANQLCEQTGSVEIFSVSADGSK
jgi:hypothetical protein